MEIKNYYNILNIPPTSTLDVIKKAYRKLALENHPDKNKADYAHEKFIEITEAYEVLRDETKRNEYDIIYHIYFTDLHQKATSKEKYGNTQYEEQKKQWEDFGRKMAEEYSAIPFEEFARKLLKEVSIGAGYIPNLIAILITTGLGISILSNVPTVENDIGGAFAIAFFLASAGGFFYLSFRLYSVAKADYFEDRKQKVK